jgi:penicillin-binding protein 1A
MHQALAGVPRHKIPVPDGIVTVRISPETGLLASSDDPNAIMEKFIEGSLPKQGGAEQSNQNPLNDGDKPLF